jgi:hypothetical protein
MELYKDLEIIMDIKRKILEWLGYMIRMDKKGLVKNVFDKHFVA